MHHFTFRKLFIGAGALALSSLVVLWSYNALSEFLGGPEAQYKHAIAAIGLLFVIKWSFSRSNDSVHEH